MADVFNWQLQRKMKYQYEESRPQKQIAWVFDTNKCIDCQTCTIACKQTWTWGTGQEYMLWNNVETKPYGFFPMAWDVKLLELMGGAKWDTAGQLTSETIFEQAPAGERAKGFLFDSEHWSHPNIGEDEPVGVGEQRHQRGGECAARDAGLAITGNEREPGLQGRRQRTRMRAQAWRVAGRRRPRGVGDAFQQAAVGARVHAVSL